MPKKSFGEAFGAATGVSDHGYRNPDPKPLRRRPSRHCSRVRWPRFSHLAHRPLPSKHGSASPFTQPGPMPKRRSEKRSAPRPGSATTATEIQIRNPCAGGQAATVAGYAGPGFHTWPTGHFLQNTDTIALIRIRRIRNGLKRRSVRRSLRRSFRTRACFFGCFPRVAFWAWYALSLQGPCDEHAIAPLPQRGNAYQPRASPWESHPKE